MPRFGKPRGSLRLRVVLIPSSILFLGMLAAIGATLLAARSRIGSENQSGVTSGSLLIGYALEKMAASENPNEAFTRLRRELANIRHISVHFEPSAEGTKITHFTRPAEDSSYAPRWFLRLFEPARVARIFPIAFNGVPQGKLVMYTRPLDEVAEVWSGLVLLAALLGFIWVSIVSLLYLTARFTLKPLHDLANGLDQLEHGQFDALDEIEVEELRRIGEKFNRLAASLGRTEADNRLLIDQLMSIQDAERKELARELHDEFGAALFGIRAAASCIVEDASHDASAVHTDIIERAQAISSLADTIQKHNYRILDRIRPVILHQMGLGDAIRQLVESWCDANRSIACALNLPDDTSPIDRLLSEQTSLTSYRMIQEGLTNIARHSGAKSAEITLTLDGEANEGTARLIITIEDDGVGLPANFRFGFGFLGMSERVRKTGGRLEIGKDTCGGTLIRAFIPLGGIAKSATPAHGEMPSSMIMN